MENIICSTHHLIPVSRLPALMINPLNSINTLEKNKQVHKFWHEIFFNLTPSEALIFYMTEIAPNDFKEAEIIVDWESIISERFVLGETASDIKILEHQKKNFMKTELIFGQGFEAIDVPRIIIKEWAPSNYFYFVRAVDRSDRVFEHFSLELGLSKNIV